MTKRYKTAAHQRLHVNISPSPAANLHSALRRIKCPSHLAWALSTP